MTEDYLWAGQKRPKTCYIKLPLFLFEEGKWSGLSAEAKVLYGLLLRRENLSNKNGWQDEYDRVFVYYQITQVMHYLNCCRQKAVKTLRELEWASLVEIKRKGGGRPNVLYPRFPQGYGTTDF